MREIVIILIIIIVIVYIVIKNKKKNNYTIQTTIKQAKYNNPNEQQVNVDNYLPQKIHQVGLQTLETIHIIGTSKAIDTIKGRYEFLLKIIDVLKKGQSNSRYLSDIQKSIDQYKSMYYDRVPQDYELALLLKPSNFDLTDFYCKALFAAFKRNCEIHQTEIKLLKHDNAKLKRKEKIKEIISLTKDELKNKCSFSQSYSTIMSELENIENTMQSENGSVVVNTFLQVEQAQYPSTANTIDSFKANSSIATKETEFILNPRAPFELTLLSADKTIGSQIRKILLDENYAGIADYKKRHQIVALFVEFNLKVKEVEEYKKKYSKTYFNKIDELKNNSQEWKSVDEKEKEDMLKKFQQIAVKEIYEKANCDIVTLFEKEPKDITIDHDLIKEYGFDNLENYFHFADNLDKVRVIPNDSYNRQRFEKLTEIGLAIRGNSIPLEEILSTLSLKDLNDIAKNEEKEFKRKNQVIEYILSLSNIEEKISSKISLRELFKLRPLPEKYALINLKEIMDKWSYITEVVSLLVYTYQNANYSIRMLKEDRDIIEGYSVINSDKEEFMCPCAKTLINKKYSKSRPPRIPCHIGCNCQLESELDLDD
jgi:hypothetical protein